MPEDKRLEEISSRLEGVKGKEWIFDPEHEMFVGTTNMLVLYDRVLDLGRKAVEWRPNGVNDSGVAKYELAPWCKHANERTEALGRFLEQCREDMAYLLEKLKEKSA